MEKRINRTVKISVRMTVDEKRRLETMARTIGLSTSTYLRMIATTAQTPKTDQQTKPTN